MVVIQERVPTLDEFRAVAESVDWGDHFHWPTMRDSLAASLLGAVAVHQGEAIGVARIVGDGVRYFYLQDVMVRPERSDEGVASALVRSLVGRVERVAAPRAFLGLFASPEARDLYAELGFTTDDMTGMHRLL